MCALRIDGAGRGDYAAGMAETLDGIIDLIARADGSRVIQAPSGLAQSAAFIAALKAAPEAAAQALFTGLFIPGVDTFDFTNLHPTTEASIPLMAPYWRGGFEAGRVAPLRLSYRKFYARLAAREGDFSGVDVGVAVVTPGEGGTFCFGVAADAGPAMLTGARFRVALVNEAAPRIANARSVAVPREAFCMAVPIEEPLNWVKPEAPPQGPLAVIAERVARLIREGDVLQFGIGKLPGAVLTALAVAGAEGLKIHSGLYSDSVLDLWQAGAISDDADAMLAGTALGGSRLARRLADIPQARFAPVSVTHDPRVMARHKQFTAINGALQVDLFGQVNAEFVGGKLVSGPGGSPDFAAGANLAEDGRLIIALPATAGEASRITPRLDAPWVTLPSGLVHYVVTEHGVAALAGKTLEETAEALIAIAAPKHQAMLQQAWGQIRGGM